MSVRILCLGGGSGFFFSALRDIALEPELAGSEIVLFDRKPDRMKVVARYVERVSEAVGARLKVRRSTRADGVFRDVDYCISSLGVHGPNQRDHIRDILICREHGILHTTGDTVGPAAVSIALRLVPVYVEFGRKLARRPPSTARCWRTPT